MCPLKGGFSTGWHLLRLSHWQRVLIQLLLMRLLISDILTHSCLIQAHGTYTVPTCPKVIPGQVFAFAEVSTVDQNG